MTALVTRFAAWAVLAAAGIPAVTVPSAVTECVRPAGDALPGESFSRITADGAWCWFGDPRAVTYESLRRRTYVGWVNAEGDIQVGSYDHARCEVEVATVRERFQQNDHASPAVLVRPDGRLTVFYTHHRGDRIYHRTSVYPEDVTSWGEELMIGVRVEGYGGYTYPNAVYLADDERRFFLFFRGPNYQPSFVTSGDGAVWSGGRVLVHEAGERPYVKVASDGVGVIHFAFTDGHPRLEPSNGIHYACYRDGAFFRADGTRIAEMDELPISPGQCDTVYDGREAPSWIWDVAADAEGRPVVVYAVFPEEGDHRYRYSRWWGGSWRDHEIVSAGSWFPRVEKGEKRFEPHYSGGVTLDHSDPAVVYLSRPVGGVFEIERWHTPDGGETWSSEPVTAGSRRDNVRPCVPRGSTTGGPRVLWMHGDYTDYAEFDTAIRMDCVDEFGDVVALMRRVFEWQLEEIKDSPEPTWVQSVFMMGVTAAHAATGDDAYLDAVLAWSEANKWKLGPRKRHADDHAAAQVYLDLAATGASDAGITAALAAFDRVIAEPRMGREEWSWCDALFMAPPAMAQLSALTGDSSYVSVMGDMWWDVTDLLYDRDDHLFHRDEESMVGPDGEAPRSWRGSKLFWLRGNGWVMAGAVRVLDALPADHVNRSRFIDLLVEMSEAIAPRQAPDGLWRTSILDSHDWQPPETSGSALVCYSLAWGVNRGILDRQTYVPVIKRAWTGLSQAVDDDGRLGWVQPVGARPAFATEGQTAPYGAGALLLAGSEVLKLESASERSAN